QRNLDHAVFVFADDRFFGDDVGDIFADGFADFLAMAQAVAGRAVGAFGVGDPVFAEDGIAVGHGYLSGAVRSRGRRENDTKNCSSLYLCLPWRSLCFASCFRNRVSSLRSE